MDMRLILLATDGSRSALKALEFAADLARTKKAKLLIIYVQRFYGAESLPPELAEFARVENVRLSDMEIHSGISERIVRDAERTARGLGVAEIDVQVVEGDPARSIVETAKERNVDVIVIGSHGLGAFEGLLLGSVSHKVAHWAPCTCIIVR